MGYKLLALDMDGTLLNEERRVTDESRYWIRKARSRGIRVMLASGRHASLVDPFARELELDMPYVANNGCEIWHPDGALLRRIGLLQEDMEYIRTLSAEFGLACYSYAAEGIFTPSTYPADGGAFNWLMALIRCPDPAMLLSLRAKLGDMGRYEISLSGEDKLDINPPGVCKADGVEYVCRQLNISAREVAAIGDSSNDISLLKWAGLGIAMGNADDEVKAAADCVTASNREEGAARAIERILHGQA